MHSSIMKDCILPSLTQEIAQSQKHQAQTPQFHQELMRNFYINYLFWTTFILIC